MKSIALYWVFRVLACLSGLVAWLASTGADWSVAGIYGGGAIILLLLSNSLKPEEQR